MKSQADQLANMSGMVSLLMEEGHVAISAIWDGENDRVEKFVHEFNHD